MSWKNLTIGKKIVVGYSVVLCLLALLAILNYLGIQRMKHDAEEVIDGNKLVAMLHQKEVDHLNWVANVSSLLNNEDVSSLSVETDDHKCGFGKWLYGSDRKKAEQLVPSLAPLIKKIEKPHYLLHQSAIQINNVFQQADITLPTKILEFESVHHAWAGRIKDSLITGASTVSNVETDPEKCVLGEWLKSVQAKNAYKNGDEDFKKTWDSIQPIHVALHESANRLKKALADDDLMVALRIFDEEARPALNGLIKLLDTLRKEAIHQLQGMQEANDVYSYQTIPALHKIQKLLAQINAETHKNIMSDDFMLKSIDKTVFQVSILAAVALVAGILIAFFTGRGLVNLLTSVVGQLSQSSSEVTSASEQIASSSHSLAGGTSEQAVTLEETSASLEQISSLTLHNDENSKKADNIMRETQEAINTADGAMKKLTVSMEEISIASSEIKNIVKSIDEIAFQTNLLALNAAVEAARAGEAGAGFAVVADEVRNLAMRSAESAKNTSVLIDSTVEKVTAGAAQLKITTESFEIAAQSSSKVSTLVSEVATASSEQSQGIEQINKAISEIDKVTQSNAAAAEQSASTAEELSAQAAAMDDIVHDLQQMVGGRRLKGNMDVDGINGAHHLEETARKEKKLDSPPLSADKRTTHDRQTVFKSASEKMISLGDDFEEF
ncbi:MAG: CZB domain-containing protein [Desulfobulbaceae bacterium]|nr:CZB domain-containing protein [Desulfobulbaceae bacterium]